MKLAKVDTFCNIFSYHITIRNRDATSDFYLHKHSHEAKVVTTDITLYASRLKEGVSNGRANCMFILYSV